MGAGHKIPVSCESSYIGQTLRCLNGHLHKQVLLVKQYVMQFELACHSVSCGCCLREWERISVLSKVKDGKERLLLEAIFIYSTNGCASKPRNGVNDVIPGISMLCILLQLLRLLLCVLCPYILVCFDGCDGLHTDVSPL